MALFLFFFFPFSIFTFFALYFLFIYFLLYNTVLVLPYIDMNLPQVHLSSQPWTPLPLPSPYHLSGSSPCTSPKHPVSCIEHRLAIHFLHDSIHVSMSFSQIIPPSPSPSESKFLSIELLMLSDHLILCHSLLLLPSIFPSIRFFSNESADCPLKMLMLGSLLIH